MEKTGKVWGSTSPIFVNNNIEIHRIEGNKGGYCSVHCHQMKYNLFFVESGALRITITKDYGSGILKDVTILGAGELTIVAPGQYHKFEILEDCVAFEVYWVELDPHDIDKEIVGGIDRAIVVDKSI